MGVTLVSGPPNNLETNLGRMPVIHTEHGSIGQSSAINFYIATENGLMGSSSFEAAQIISISEHIKEVRTAYTALVPYGSEPSEEALEKWFYGGAKDSIGTADGSQRSARFLNWWLGRIEVVVGSEGYTVGSKISLADILIYNAFGEYLKSTEAPEGMAQYFCETGDKFLTLRNTISHDFYYIYPGMRYETAGQPRSYYSLINCKKLIKKK